MILDKSRSKPKPRPKGGFFGALGSPSKATKLPGRPKAAIPGRTFIERYRTFCYRVLGRRLDLIAEGKGESYIDPLVVRLRQAGVRNSPGMFRAVRMITTLISVGVLTAVALVLFGAVLRPPLWPLYVGALVGLTALAVPLTYSFLLSAQISGRSTRLERELPFTLSELSVFASTGMSPIELVHKMARRDRDATMTAAFKEVVYKTDIQGKDLITSLSETAKESPSPVLRENFWGLANMIHQGGNIDEYLRQKSEDVLKLKRAGQRAFIERLTTYVDMYISLILIGVLMICVGAFMLNAFGSTAFGLDSNSLLLMLTFGLVPVAVTVTVIMVITAYARSE